MSELSIISTGNEEVDQRRLAAAQLHEDRMNEGICPNGCAELEWETQHKGSCPE